MLARGRRRRGSKVSDLLVTNGIVCAVCCVAFPQFVGPLDLHPDDGGGVHDPSARLVPAVSPEGTVAIAEVTQPSRLMVGTIVFDVTNKEDLEKRNVVVRLPIDRCMVINPKSYGGDLTITPTEVRVVFDAIGPHCTENKALDYTIDKATESHVFGPQPSIPRRHQLDSTGVKPAAK